MCKSSLKSTLVFLLIFSITFFQIVPSFASANKNKLRVAFVGIKFENLPQDILDILSWRMTAILESQESFILTKPEAAKIAYGREKIAELLEKQDIESFSTFAKQFQFDHVYSGFLVNQSSDNHRFFFVGELNRYDLSTGHINRYMINKDYEKFGNELVKFQDQYVNTLSVAEDSGLNPWLLAGLIVAAVIASSLAISTGGGEGEETEPGPIDE